MATMASRVTLDLKWRALLGEARAHQRWGRVSRLETRLEAAVNDSNFGEALRHQLT